MIVKQKDGFFFRGNELILFYATVDFYMINRIIFNSYIFKQHES